MSSMCTIIEKNGKYNCQLRIQDGIERWEESTLEKAQTSLIQADRIMNGNYTLAYEINHIVDESEPDRPPGIRELWDDIRRGNKVVLERSDPRVKYRLTDDECELIIKIREGTIKVVNT